MFPIVQTWSLAFQCFVVHETDLLSLTMNFFLVYWWRGQTDMLYKLTDIVWELFYFDSVIFDTDIKHSLFTLGCWHFINSQENLCDSILTQQCCTVRMILTQTDLVFFIRASSSGVWYSQALEMSVGKIPFLEAVNGSTVMLPCTYSSCIGIKNLYFKWQFNDNGTMQNVRRFCLKDSSLI